MSLLEFHVDDVSTFYETWHRDRWDCFPSYFFFRGGLYYNNIIIVKFAKLFEILYSFLLNYEYVFQTRKYVSIRSTNLSQKTFDSSE